MDDAIKLLNGEELEDSNSAGALTKGKGNNKNYLMVFFNFIQVQVKQPPKVDNKKASKKGGKEEVIEEKKDMTVLEKEMKKSLLTEKVILRYRFTVIKNMAINRIKEMRLMAKAVYNKLEDWVVYSIKCENDAVYELVKRYIKLLN